jgi:hypothetical protein
MGIGGANGSTGVVICSAVATPGLGEAEKLLSRPWDDKQESQ